MRVKYHHRPQRLLTSPADEDYVEIMGVDHQDSARATALEVLQELGESKVRNIPLLQRRNNDLPDVFIWVLKK